MKKYTKDECLRLLREKQEEIIASGEKRYPSKKDFSDTEVNAIKSFLGPWPRALEAAGVKEADPMRLEKKKLKRIEQKRKQTQRKIENQHSGE